MKGLRINILIKENEIDWGACWDSQINMDGYLSYLLETEANVAAMSAIATAAAVGGSLTRCSNLETMSFKFLSKLISAQINGSG